MMKLESCGSGHVLEGQEKPTENVRVAAGNFIHNRC